MASRPVVFLPNIVFNTDELVVDVGRWFWHGNRGLVPSTMLARLSATTGSGDVVATSRNVSARLVPINVYAKSL